MERKISKCKAGYPASSTTIKFCPKCEWQGKVKGEKAKYCTMVKASSDAISYIESYFKRR